jgi:tetratricopeptide (TPR) repeat protein
VAWGLCREFRLRMLRLISILWLLCLVACVSGRPAASVGPGTGTDAGAAPPQWEQAMQLLADQNWPQAIAALRVTIDAKSFDRLPEGTRYKALSTAGNVMVQHGTLQVGYGYLVRATAMPEATFSDWLGRLQAARRLQNEGDAVACLTTLVRKWPAKIGEFNSGYLSGIVDQSRSLPRNARLFLLQALYEAHWKLKWDVEPSTTWRDLALLLLDKGRLAEAIDVSGHVTDVYVLVAMRADRRFDAVVAASRSQFDIDAASEREFHWYQAASEKAPQSLELQSDVLLVLQHQQRYAAMLASADAVLLAIQSTNFPTKLYQDYYEMRSWFLNLRETALERAGRWDEAVAELAKASQLSEKNTGNVSQLINLGALYCDLGRPKEALSAIGSVVAATSPYGASAMELVRLDAAVQMGDSIQVERSLRFIRTHRADSPFDYVYALILVNQPARAADQLIGQLRDADERQNALLFVQTYAPAMRTPRQLDLDARQRAVIAQRDVQAAIRKVGRVESYRLESSE